MSSKNVPVIPDIIQGGMGVYISNPLLANTVSSNGALGTVSGVLARILGKGDVGGHYRRALSHFPFPHISKQVIDAFYIEGGDVNGALSKDAPFFSVNPSNLLIALSICANYAFVYLAKEGHGNPVSINYLEKIALPHVYAITGAMLAGVDFITMGAGIPLQIPEVINSIAEGRLVTYRIPVTGQTITSHTVSFNPEDFFGEKLPELKKPGFIPIIASNLLASIFMKKLPQGSVHGFVIEEPSAGGHNAPPRKGDTYGPKDEVDYLEIQKLGLPFWIGGSKATPGKLRWAQSLGATGIQVGSIFALCKESGMDSFIRRKVCELGFKGELEARTDRQASPTGFPFKVAILMESLSEQEVYLARDRVCPHGVLRTLFELSDGSIGYRCPAEPLALYVKKLGKLEETLGARCVCSGLMATAGLGKNDEIPIVTMGDDVGFLKFLMSSAEDSYGVVEALRYLRG